MRLLAFIEDTKEGKLLSTLALHLEEGQYELAKGVMMTLFSMGSERVKRGIIKLLGDLVRWGTLRSETQEAELHPNVPCWYWYKGTTLGKSGSMTNLFQFMLLVNGDYQQFLEQHCESFPDEKCDFPCPLLTNSSDSRLKDFKTYLCYLRQGDTVNQLIGTKVINCFEGEYTHILRQLLGRDSGFCPPHSVSKGDVDGEQLGVLLFSILEDQSSATRPLSRHFIRGCCAAAGDLDSSTGLQCWVSYLSNVVKHIDSCLDKHQSEEVLKWLTDISLHYTTADGDTSDAVVSKEAVEELLVPLFTKIRTCELFGAADEYRVTAALLAAEDPTAAHLYESVCGDIVGKESHISQVLFKTPRGPEVNWNACLEIAASGNGSPWYLTFQRALQVIDVHLSRGGTDEKLLRQQLQPLFETETMDNLKWLLLIAVATGVSGVPWKRRRIPMGSCCRCIASLNPPTPSDAIFRYLYDTAVFDSATQYSIAGLLVRAASTRHGDVITEVMVGQDDVTDSIGRVLRRRTDRLHSSSEADAEEDSLDQVGRVASVLGRFTEVSFLSTFQPFASLLDFDQLISLAMQRPTLSQQHIRYKNREINLLHASAALDAALKSCLHHSLKQQLASHLKSLDWPQLRVNVKRVIMQFIFLKKDAIADEAVRQGNTSDSHICDIDTAYSLLKTLEADTLLDSTSDTTMLLSWIQRVIFRLELARWLSPEAPTLEESLYPASSYLAAALQRDDKIKAMEIRKTFYVAKTKQKGKQPISKHSHQPPLEDLLLSEIDFAVLGYNSEKDISDAKKADLDLFSENGSHKIVSIETTALSTVEGSPESSKPFSKEAHSVRILLSLLQRQNWGGISDLESLKIGPVLRQSLEYLGKARICLGDEVVLERSPDEHLLYEIYSKNDFNAAEKYASLIQVNPRIRSLILSAEEDGPQMSSSVLKWMRKELPEVAHLSASVFLHPKTHIDVSIIKDISSSDNPFLGRLMAYKLSSLRHFCRTFGGNNATVFDTSQVVELLLNGGGAQKHSLKVNLLKMKDPHLALRNECMAGFNAVSVMVKELIEIIKHNKSLSHQIPADLSAVYPAAVSLDPVSDDFYKLLADRHQFSTSLDEALSHLSHSEFTLSGPSDASLTDAAHLILRTALQLHSNTLPLKSSTDALTQSATYLLARVSDHKIVLHDFLMADVYTPILHAKYVADLINGFPFDVSSPELDGLRVVVEIYEQLQLLSKDDIILKGILSEGMMSGRIDAANVECINSVLNHVVKKDSKLALDLFSMAETLKSDPSYLERLRGFHCEYICSLVDKGDYFSVSRHLQSLGSPEETREVCLTFASSSNQTLESKEIIAGIGGIQHEVLLGLRLLNSLSDRERSEVMLLVKRPDLLAEQLIRDGKVHHVHRAMKDFPEVLPNSVIRFYAHKSMVTQTTSVLHTRKQSRDVFLTPSTQRFPAEYDSFDELECCRTDFYYNESPSLSLCMSLIGIIQDDKVGGDICIEIAFEVSKQLAIPRNPSRKHVIAMVETLARTAQKRHLSLGQAIEYRSEELIRVIRVLKTVEISVGFLYEKNHPWDVDEQDVEFFGSLTINSVDDVVTVNKIIALLVKFDRIQVALEIASKAGVHTDIVWLSHGLEALKLGWWQCARESFAKVTPQHVAAKLNEIHHLLEGPPIQRDATFGTDGSVVVPSADILIGSQSCFTTGLNKSRYRETVFYTKHYGSDDDLVSFYVRGHELTKALQHFIESKMSSSAFISKIFIPLRDPNELPAGGSDLLDLRACLLSVDNSLGICRSMLFAICKYLRSLSKKKGEASASMTPTVRIEKLSILEELTDWQNWMCDYVRSALTARDRFLLEVEHEKKVRLIESCIHNLQQALQSKQPHQQDLSASSSFVFRDESLGNLLEQSSNNSNCTPRTRVLESPDNTSLNFQSPGPDTPGQQSLTSNRVLNDRGIALPPSHMSSYEIKEFLELAEMQKAVLTSAGRNTTHTLFGTPMEQRYLAEEVLPVDFQVGFQLICKLKLPRQVIYREAVRCMIQHKEDKKIEGTLRQMKDTVPATDLDDIVLECIESLTENSDNPDYKIAEKLIILITAPSIEAARAWLYCKKWKRAYFIAAEMAFQPGGMSLVNIVMQHVVRAGIETAEAKKVVVACQELLSRQPED